MTYLQVINSFIYYDECLMINFLKLLKAINNILIFFSVDFNNKLVSLHVIPKVWIEGQKGTTRCCFGVYSEPKFKGDFQHFRWNPLNDGKYESASDMGELFRAATSIQLLDESCTEAYDA